MIQKTENFCQDCGSIINIRAEICPKCGVRQPYSYKEPKDDRWLITLLLCWFLGFFGIHRFYTGHTVIGIIQLLTVGGCGIWTLIDFIMIIIGNFKDAQGNPIKNN